MRHVVVIGSGLVGLLTAILLARRGIGVTIVEKDGDDLSEEAAGAWLRAGVGHATQTHSFLAVSSRVLAAEVPDVLAALQVQAVTDEVMPLGDDGPRPLFDRRLGYEKVLRDKARAEPNIAFRLGLTVTALTTQAGSTVPLVTGVQGRSADGEIVSIAGDLVVDASGRKSPVRRLLEQLGAAPLVEETHNCDFQYLTRWYRLKDGISQGELVGAIRARTCFGSFLLCPAAGRRFSISMVMSAHDPLRHVFRAGDTFDAFMRSIPRTGVLINAAEPTDDPVPFGGIENRRRKLVDAEGKPIVAGLVLVGDSAMHTNPTMGRGTSLGFLQAQWLAGNVGHAFSGPLSFAAAYAEWQQREIAYWFDSQAAADAEHCNRLRALAHGEPLPPLSMEGRLALALQLLSSSNSAVAQAFARVFHMLARPVDALGDPAVGRPVEQYLAAHPELTEMREGSPRAELVGVAAL